MRVADKECERRFDALFDAHLANMVAYCGWRAQSTADAEDAVSEVFLAAWRRLDEVPAGEEARLWLYGTARRVMANQARTSRRQALLHVRLSSVPVSVLDGVGDWSDEAASPAVEAVREALGALKPVDQEVLLLSEWEGLAPTQIAKVMRCPLVTARGRLFRARRRFRTALDELGLEPQARESAGELSGVVAPERSVGSPGAVISR